VHGATMIQFFPYFTDSL